MEDDPRDFYDARAQEIADEWYPNDVLMPTIQEFLSLLPENPRVLDLGCGPGHESMRLARAGAEVVGVDFSPESIRIARERTPQCTFHELDFRQLDDRWGTFDGVFASAALIHVAPEELPDLLSRLASILNQGGKLLVIVQDGDWFRTFWPEVNGRQVPWTMQAYQRDSLEDLASPSAFRLLQEGYLAPELREDGWRCYIFELAHKA
jgi:trans-aconitate methyltransferase